MLFIFIGIVQLAVNWWQAKPAPRFPVLTENRFENIAHRGGHGEAPANTLEAMHSAMAAGADVLEMDIHMSRDGHLVVFHDQTLDRTTPCKGDIKHKTLTQLKACDKGYYYSPANKGKETAGDYPFRNRGVQIPTLYDLFSTFPDQRMIIEMKQAEPSLVSEFCRMIRSFEMQDLLIIGSLKQQPMDKFREECPEVATSATPKEAALFILANKIGLSGAISPVYALLQVPPSVDLPGFLPELDITTPALLKGAHAKGLLVQVWTINDAALMRTLFEMGIDGIMTDYPSRLAAIVRENR